MKKLNFIGDYLKIFNSDEYQKINLFIKNNVCLIPIIYIMGTMILIFRNKLIGLPFEPISLIQFAVIVTYFVLFFLLSMNIENLLKKISDNKNNKEKLRKYCCLYAMFLSFCFYFISFLINNNKLALIFFLFFYFAYPIFLHWFKAIKLVGKIMYISVYLILICNIPLSLGGFKGQNVYFYENDSNTVKEYTYYGNYKDLYQFIKDNTIYLIPLDKGYIYYEINKN